MMYQTLTGVPRNYPGGMILTNGNIGNYQSVRSPMSIVQPAATPIQLTEVSPSMLMLNNSTSRSTGPKIQVLDDNVEYSGLPVTRSTNAAPSSNYVVMPNQPTNYPSKPSLTKWSWCSTVWSSISCMLFASIPGFIGLLCAIHAYVDHRSGDYMAARYKTRCACVWAGIGIFLGVLGVLAVILIFIVYYEDLQSLLNPVGYGQPAWVQK